MSKILKGIDVSYANGTINWNNVKKSGIDFAVLRCGYGSESAEQVDNQYYANAQGCIKNNISFGIYHFGYPLNIGKAVEEADFAIKLANKYPSKVKFIAYDIEADTLRYCEQAGITHTKASLTACAKSFLDRIKAAGYKPVLYTNYDYINNRYDYGELSEYYLWLAYPNAKEPGRDCEMWQYSWTGRVDGISGNVDMNFMYDNIVSNVIKADNIKPNIADNCDSQIKSAKQVDYKVRVISKDGVNIRMGADTSYKIKGAIPYGSIVKISRQTSGGGYKWGYTSYNNITGWIALDYTERASAPVYYTVKRDDTLSYIAYKYNTTVDELAKLNKIVDKDLIYTGQRIRVK